MAMSPQRTPCPWILSLVGLVLLAAACGGAASGEAPLQPATTSTSVPPATTSTTGGEDGTPQPGATPELLAAAVTQLITRDHTFGAGPPPFDTYLLQERIDPFAGDVTATGDEATRSLTAEERAAVETAVAAFGAVQWIEDPDDWRTADLMPTIDGSVIIGFGEPDVAGDTALVPMSLWCGGLCGTWLTYRVDLVDGEWQVIGTEGPIAVS